MTENRPSRFSPAVALSTFAGLLGAGVFDALTVIVRGQNARFIEVLALSAGLYGTAGLVFGALFGWAAATLSGALPGGWPALLDDESLDSRVCGLLLGSVAAGVVLAVGAGVGYASFVSAMNSRTLATIASAGIALAFVPPAALALLATWRTAASLARLLLPRPAKLGRSGVLLIALAAVGVLAFVAALSRADWRVLDLGPFYSVGIALVLGIAHGIFGMFGDWETPAASTAHANCPTRACHLGCAVAGRRQPYPRNILQLRRHPRGWTWTQARLESSAQGNGSRR